MRITTSTLRAAKQPSLAALTFVTALFLTGLYAFGPSPAKAAGLTDVQATLSDPRPTVDSNWTIQFVMPTLINENDTIVLDIDTIATADQFDLASVAEDDIDIAEDTDGSPGSCSGTLTDEETAGSATATEWGISVNTGTDTITFTSPTTAQTYIAAGACVVIEIGNHASHDGTGANRINNPTKVAAAGTADINDVAISFTGSAAADSGTALVATIEGVSVSVTIDESLSMTLAAETAANCPATVPGTDKSDDGGHTATAITYGTLSSGDAFNHSCHLVTVSTNASGGYTTTVQKTALLTSGSDTIADGTCDGGCSASTSATWSTASNNGFGYCLQDVAGNAALTTDASDDAGTGAVDWVAAAQCNDATPQFKTYPTTTTTEPVMKSYAPTSSDQIRMGAMLSYDGAQAAGTYTTTLLFITTPIF